MFNRKFLKFIKFSVVGVANTLVDWLGFFLLVGTVPLLADFEVLAKVISFLLAVTNSFILNSLWTFKEEVEEGKRIGIGFWDAKRAVKFLMTSAVGLFINTFFFVWVRGMSVSLPPLYSRILALGVATATALLWNFAVNLHWTYRIGSPSFSKDKKYDKFAPLIIVFVFLVSLFSANSDSITTDEIPHLGAGYSYLKTGRMLLNLEHPPLIKVLAAAPLLFLDIKEPSLEEVVNKDQELNTPYWVDQWNYGFKVIFGQKVSHTTILLLARIPMILLLCLTAWVTYLFGKRLFGAPAGFISLIAFSLSPNFLAHGHLITMDVGATLGFVLTLYFFHAYLEKRNRRNLILSAVALGLANLIKFSSLAIFPILLVLSFFKVFMDRRAGEGLTGKLMTVFRISIPVFLLGLIVTLAGYYLIFPNDVLSRSSDLEPLTTGNYLRHLGMDYSSSPAILKPALNYISGIASVRERIAVSSGTYILGNLSESAWWYFFPLTWLFKEPIPIILGSLAALFLLIKLYLAGRLRKARLKLLLLFVPFVLYGLFATFSKFNLGIRHILPILPITYLLVGWIGSYFWNEKKKLARIVISGFGIWLLFGTLSSFPNFLAHFNELQILSGREKFELLVDSDLDWGQNLKRLAEFVKREKIQKIKVDAWFFEEPVRYYIPEALAPGEEPPPGEERWVTVGATRFQLSKFGEEDPYANLRDLKPYSIVGDGILVYRIEKR